MSTIVYDGRNLMLEAGTGIATYTRTLAEVARGLGHDTHALVSANSFLEPQAHALNEMMLYDALARQVRHRKERWWFKAIEHFGAPRGVGSVAIRRARAAVADSVDRLQGFDLVHAVPFLFDIARHHFIRRGRRLDVRLNEPAALFHATHATPIRIPGSANIYTIHDIVPLRMPQTTLDEKPFFHGMVVDLCRHADHIVTVSEFSRADIIALTGMSPDRITNTYQAVELPAEWLARPEGDVADDLARWFQLGFGEYFLFVGAIEPKKNLLRLIEAYASSGARHPLVIAGGLGWQYEEILRSIADERFLRYVKDGNEISIRRKVRRLDYVPFNRLVALYRGARAFLFPSVYEGFGLPVVEAMSAGAPVMTSRTTSLGEVAADAALLIDPYDVDEMARAIARLDGDADLRASLSRRGRERARSFDRKSYAARIEALYRRVGA